MFDPHKKFSFENLEVYKAARSLVKEIYVLQNRLPMEERYALGDQIRRSSISITSNIAEGSGRVSIKEKIRFIEIAYGSMTESFSQLQIAQDLGYIEEKEVEAIRPSFNHVAALLSLLRRKFQQQLNNPNNPITSITK